MVAMMTKKCDGAATILSTHFASFAPHAVLPTQSGAVDVEAVNGKTDVLCAPGGGGGTTWIPESSPLSSPLYANFQQTFVCLIVIVAVPAPAAVVCRYLPVRLAVRTTSPVEATAIDPTAVAYSKAATTIPARVFADD